MRLGLISIAAGREHVFQVPPRTQPALYSVLPRYNRGAEVSASHTKFMSDGVKVKLLEKVPCVGEFTVTLTVVVCPKAPVVKVCLRSPTPCRITVPFSRQALHAARLALVHPVTGLACRWDSPLPADFALLLATLRARSKP